MPEDEAAKFFEEVFNCLHGSGSAKLKASSSTLSLAKATSQLSLEQLCIVQTL